MSQRQVQKAGVVAEDQLSQLAQDVLDNYSLQISTGGLRTGHTNAIAAIKRYIRISPERLKAAMDAIHILWSDDPCAWSGVLLRGMFEIARMNGVLPEVVAACRRRKVVPRRIMDVASAMQTAAGTSGSGGTSHARAAILKVCGIKLGVDA